jgi:starch synthase
LYGLRYGTVPIVRRVGGLADTVVDAGTDARTDARTDVRTDATVAATGFMFDAATPSAFERCVRRAIELRAKGSAWAQITDQGMSQNLSWQGPAQQYLTLYQALVTKKKSNQL